MNGRRHLEKEEEKEGSGVHVTYKSTKEEGRPARGDKGDRVEQREGRGITTRQNSTRDSGCREKSP